MTLTPGKYRAKPISSGLGFTKGNEDGSNKKECVAIRFQITEGELQGEEITCYRYFTEKSVEYTMADLRTCGWIGDDLADLSSIDEGDADLTIVLVNEDFKKNDGTVETNIKVKSIYAAGGAAMLNAPMDETARKSFAAKMRGAAVASRQGKPAVKAASKPAAKNDPHPFAPGNGNYPTEGW